MALNPQNLKRNRGIVPETKGFTARQKEWIATFDRATKKFLEDKRVNGESTNTIENYERRINYFRVFMIDAQGCSKITPEIIYDFRQWLVERGLKTSSVRQYMKEVCAFIDWCTWDEHKYYDVKVPTRAIPKGGKTNYTKVLTHDEVVKMVELPKLASGRVSTDKFYLRRRAVNLTLMMCGLRANELCMLDAKDFNMDEATIHVRHGKGDKERLLKVPKALYDSLQLYWEEGEHPDFRENPDAPLFGFMQNGEWKRLNRWKVADLVQTYTKAAIGRKLNPHALRHVAASFTYLSGASLEEVRQFLGHGSEQTTKIYLQKMFSTVSAPGIENLWDRLDYESGKAVSAVEEQEGVKIRRINVVERDFIMIATDDNGDEYELNIKAESEESARMKAVVYCNRNGLKLKENRNGTYRIRETKTE